MMMTEIQSGNGSTRAAQAEKEKNRRNGKKNRNAAILPIRRTTNQSSGDVGTRVPKPEADSKKFGRNQIRNRIVEIRRMKRLKRKGRRSTAPI
jgi:hypothetical protein